jgi:DNA-binding NtrC family response regulator
MRSSRSRRILVVEDDAAMRRSCEEIIEDEGFEYLTAESGEEAETLLNSGERFGAVLTDLKLPGMDGLGVLRLVKRIDPVTDVIVMTGYGTIQSAVEAMRLGALDYITKPFEVDDLVRCLEKVRRSTWVEAEVGRLRRELEEKDKVGLIVARSDAMLEVLARVRGASRTDATVLIEGESGTGKELVARAIHESSDRSRGPYQVINCAALPYDLVESELFGHRAGAFTGATRESDGLFRSAHGGTLVLDEVTEIPDPVQAKLLRVLQAKLVRRVGETEEKAVDTRIVAITNRSSAEALSDGSLREDLYYRLSVIVIKVPPLRDRPDDVAPLVAHFLKKLLPPDLLGKVRLDRHALELLEQYPFPGNVRELENVVAGTLALSDSAVIHISHLPARIIEHGSRPRRTSGSGVPSLRQSESELLAQALKECGGNKAAAARLLGISRQRLYRMAQEYGIRL